MKPIIAIGDIHGRSDWRPIAESHLSDYCIVFLGDYLDPYEFIPHQELLANLRALLTLKKKAPDDVILLLGNHDVHYFNPDAPVSSRFDFPIKEKVCPLFMENRHLFQYAYQEGNKLFTHAGVSQEWFEQDFQGDISRPIAEQLNHPAEHQIAALYRVGQARGGKLHARGGIFWADIQELDDPLHGFTQIVGHNRVKDITVRKGTHENEIIFCDCLRQGKYYDFNTSNGNPPAK